MDEIVRAETAVPLGIYRIEWTVGGWSLASVYMDRRGVRWLAPTNWTVPGKLADHIHKIQKLQPLERQGGISGAMYWGDETR